MRRRRITVLALLVACLAAPASAQELAGTLRKVKATGVLAVGSEESVFPFSYLASGKNVIGYSIDVCDKPMRALVRDTLRKLFTGGSIRPIHEKWFLRTLPNARASLNLPASETLEKVFRNPTDSADPVYYH